jgi:hypothetical protein
MIKGKSLAVGSENNGKGQGIDNRYIGAINARIRLMAAF